MAYRRARGDMIEVYKIIHEIYDSKTTDNILKLRDKIQLSLRGHNYILEHKRLHNPMSRGVPRIWEGGGKKFFFRFGNLHVAKRHTAHGEAMRIARGVRGHAPPRKFFKTVQFGAF